MAALDRPKISLRSGGLAADISPMLGFSLLSLRRDGREFLDPWDICEFEGGARELEAASRESSEVFRKGFGPSIGPWFGPRPGQDSGWQHGLCRYADWRENLEISGTEATGRLDGSRSELVGTTLDEICGFHLDVTMTYSLSDAALSLEIQNDSEGFLGTFGIHWYFKNPLGTRVILWPDMTRLPGTSPSRLRIESDRVIADPVGDGSVAFANRAAGPDAIRARIAYPDGCAVDFRHDDDFARTVLFGTRNALCVEPVSGPPREFGTFRRGGISVTPG